MYCLRQASVVDKVVTLGEGVDMAANPSYIFWQESMEKEATYLELLGL